MRSHAALKIRPAGSSLFVVRVRRDFDAVVHGSLDIARFVVEISTLGIRGGNGAIHSRTRRPLLQEGGRNQVLGRLQVETLCILILKYRPRTAAPPLW